MADICLIVSFFLDLNICKSLASRKFLEKAKPKPTLSEQPTKKRVIKIKSIKFKFATNQISNINRLITCPMKILRRFNYTLITTTGEHVTGATCLSN